MAQLRLRGSFSLLIAFILLGCLMLTGCAADGEGEISTDGEDEISTDGEDEITTDVWPENTIRIIDPYSPGGGTDQTARQLQPHLEESLGVPIVVDSRSGGGGVVGFSYLVTHPDGDEGYLIGTFPSPHLEFSIMTMDTPYQLEDFAMLGGHCVELGVIRIHKDETRFNDLPTLIEYARQYPGEVTFSIGSINSFNTLGVMLIEEATGVDFNIVGFEGGNPARMALVGRHVDATHAGAFNSLHIADDTKVIAVHYKENPIPQLTDNAPTVDEALGMEVPYTSVVGNAMNFFAVPKKFKDNYPERYEILVEAYKNANHNPALREAVTALGQEDRWVYRSPEEATKQMQDYLMIIQEFEDWFN